MRRHVTAYAAGRRAGDRLLPLRSAVPVVVITLLGLALRLAVTRGIWVDEAASLRQAQLPYAQMIVELRDHDVHAPLYHSVLWLVLRVTDSTGEFVLRAPSLVAGTALIPLLYFVGTDLWDRRTGLLAALLGAVAPIAVWYAQEARMYAFWMLGATLAIWSQCRILRHRPGSAKDWAVFTGASAFTLYNQHFSWLPLVVANVVFLAVAWIHRRPPDGRAFARRWLWSVLALTVLVLPLLPFLATQLRLQAGAHLGPDTPPVTPGQADTPEFWGDQPPDVYAALANVNWVLWGYHTDSVMALLGALWPVALLLGLALLGRSRSEKVWLLIAVAVVPMLLLFAAGFKVRLIFELRYFTATVPAVLLLCARMVASWGVGRITRVVLPGVLVAAMLVGLADQQLNPDNPRRYDFRSAVEWLRANGSANDELIYAPAFLHDPLRYYRPGIPMRSLDGTVPAPGPQRRVFVVGSFLDDPRIAASLDGLLAGLDRTGRLVDRRHYTNIEIWEYA